MLEEMQNDDLDQNFWNEVDALRAMLDEEENEKPQTPTFDISREPVPPRPCLNVDVRSTLENQLPKTPRRNPPVFTPDINPQRREIPYAPPVPRKAGFPRRPSKGALITLYTIIILELGAITAVAYHWYEWIH